MIPAFYSDHQKHPYHRKNCSGHDRLNSSLNIEAMWHELAGFFLIIVYQYLQFLHLQHFVMRKLHRLHKSFGFLILERILICP